MIEEIFEDEGNVAVQGYDIRHKVIYWNRASERLYGYRREEALGQKLEDLIIPDFMRSQVHDQIETWLRSGIPPFGGVLELLRKDGSTVKVHSSHIINRTGAGSATMYCIDREVGPSSKFASVQSSPNTPGDFSDQNAYSCLSHEIRTPLNAIAGLSELLRLRDRRPFSSEEVEMVETIFRSAYRLLGSFEHLIFQLGWARGDLQPTQKTVSLFDLVVQAIQSVSDTCAIENVRIDFSEKNKEQSTIQSDPYFLGQAVYAILMGAIYTSEKHGAVTVAIIDHREEDQLLIEIKDTGPHIDPGLLLHIIAGEKDFTKRKDARSHGHILFLPVAQDIAVALGAMFTIDKIYPTGNRYILAIPTRSTVFAN